MADTIASFYRFAPIADPASARDALEALATDGALRGTVLVAREGINAQVAGCANAIDAFVAAVCRRFDWSDLRVHRAPVDAAPFRRLRVRVRDEIVALGCESDPERTGARADAARWDALLAERDVTVIDVRNHYEVALGTFDGAIDPGTAAFRDFPAWAEANLDPARDRRIAMFCTGGIRCEKASAWLRARGFDDVVQLDGGILGYLDAADAHAGRWRGSCFVFDERGAVGRGKELPKAR